MINEQSSDEPPLDDAALDAITTGFVDSMKQLPASGFRGRAQVRAQDHPIALTSATWGLCAHTHHVSALALEHLASDDLLAAAPLARIAFESSITAQWLVHVPNSVDGFVHEQLRQQRALASEAVMTSWGVGMESAAQLAAKTIPDAPSVTPRRFEQICADLHPAGPDAYVHYRWLSHFCHTSGAIVDAYAEETERPGSPIHFSRTPMPLHVTENIWLCRYLIAASNVWAAAALDWVDYDHARVRQVKDAARTLHIASELRLSDAAWVRETQAARTLRRQARDSRAE